MQPGAVGMAECMRTDVTDSGCLCSLAQRFPHVGVAEWQPTGRRRTRELRDSRWLFKEAGDRSNRLHQDRLGRLFVS